MPTRRPRVCILHAELRCYTALGFPAGVLALPGCCAALWLGGMLARWRARPSPARPPRALLIAGSIPDCWHAVWPSRVPMPAGAAGLAQCRRARADVSPRRPESPGAAGATSWAWCKDLRAIIRVQPRGSQAIAGAALGAVDPGASRNTSSSCDASARPSNEPESSGSEGGG